MSAEQYKRVSPLETLNGLVLYLILLFAGVLGVYANIYLLPGVYFFFGSIALLTALYIYRTGWGIGLGLIVAAAHYFLWNQIYVFIIFFGEVLFIAFTQKKGIKLFIADAFYWLLAGIPAGWIVFYFVIKMNLTLTMVIVLKLLVNGMLNALIASILVTYLPLDRFVGPSRYEYRGRSFYQSIFTGLAAFILIPSLLLMFAQSRREIETIEKNILTDLDALAGLGKGQLELWHSQHLYALTSLANLSASPGITEEELQKATDNLKRGFFDYTRLHIDDTRGIALTFSPQTDDRGRSNVGLDFTGWDYFPIIKNTGQPYLSDIYMSRLGEKAPIVTMGVPILRNGAFDGYAVSNIDLNNLYTILKADSQFGRSQGYVSILDSRGKVIVTTRSDLNMMDDYYYKMKGNRIAVNDSSYVWIPDAYKNSHEALQWDKAVYVKKSPMGSDFSWDIIVEIPYSTYMENMSDTYARYLGFMSVLLLLTLVISSYISRKVAAPVAELAAATSVLPQKMEVQNEGLWPDTNFYELNALISNFRSMAGTIHKNFNDMQGQYTALKQAERLIWEEKERALVTLHSIGDAVITTNALGNVTYLNPVAETLTGWSSSEAFERPLLDIFKIVNEQTGEPVENPVEKCLREGAIVGLANHTELISKEGAKIAIEDSAAPIRDRDGRVIGVVLVFHDVSEKRNMMQQMMHQAYHDPLTGLPNRVLFHDRLEQALAQAKRSGEFVAVLFMDLDRFKMVNDMLGHIMGDQLLKEVAARLSDSIRSSDTLARLGGDEFTLLLTKLAHVNDAAAVAQKVLTSLKEPFVISGHEFHISASVGVSVFPNDGLDAETLMKNSDTAMYRSKEAGQNSYELFTPSMNEKIHEQIAMENSLRHALERNEFEVFYQPQVDAISGEIVGMEALLRWNHPVQGLVPPGDFIPLAEETGLIVSIGEWVLKTACIQNKAWQNAGYKHMRVTVNLSGYQFRQGDLLEKVADVLNETGLDPGCLELEITESIAMEDVPFTIQILKNLNQMGISIAIDDFGTGYSSLSYIKLFPVATIKIDRSFIMDITSDPGDAAIVATIIVMAKNLNLKVIAEGVETIEQINFLKRHQCNEMQGFYFSKPVPARDFEELIKQGTFTGSADEMSWEI